MNSALAPAALLVSALGGLAANTGELTPHGLAILAAKVVTCARSGPAVVDHGVVLLSQGRIESVGPAASTAIPFGS